MASFRSGFHEVEERKRVLYTVAPWDSRFGEEQASVGMKKILKSHKD